MGYGANSNSEINYVIEATAPDCVRLFLGCTEGQTRTAEMKGEFISRRNSSLGFAILSIGFAF